MGLQEHREAQGQTRTIKVGHPRQPRVTRHAANGQRTKERKRQNMKAKKSQAKAKTLKTRAAKKPPEATESHAAIEDWIRRVMPDLHPIVKRLDELICTTISGLQYAVKWK